MSGDKYKDQQRTPLADALGAMEGRISFHMPGHRQGRLFQSPPALPVSAFDTTELEESGDLAAPAAHVLEAYRLASSFFGAGESWFITSGTTSSIFIMMATVLREGDQVIMPRAVHIAAVHAVAILGLRPVFVASPDGRDFPDGQPDASSYISTMQRYPGAKACYVTRPDYYGRAMDLASLAGAAKEAGMALLVDEAHGAHFAAAPDLLPATALSQGADMTCQSAHKTLPALTPASLLHVSEEALDSGRVNPSRLAGLVKVFQTSSPSFLVAASIDTARAEAAQRGHAAISRLIRLNRNLCDRLPACYQRFLPAGADQSRLVIDYAGTGRDRIAFQAHLHDAGIDAELIDLTRAVFIPGFDQSGDDYECLFSALSSLQVETDPQKLEDHARKMDSLSCRRDAFLSAEALFGVSPRQALFGRVAGPSVAGEAVAPYPPGMPILWPGEPVTDSHRLYLEKLLAEGIVVRGFPPAFPGGQP